MPFQQERMAGRFTSLVPQGVDVPEGYCYCRECMTVMPYSAFLPHYTKRTRRSSVCRKCLPNVRGPRRPKRVRPANIALEPGQRWCASCQEVKSEGDFHKKSSYCKPCHLDSNRRSLYGLGRGEYELRLAEQGGVCAICGNPCKRTPDKLCVDHDHVTGSPRGLLCSECNRGIGCFGDDVDRLCAAIKYLKRWK